MGGIVSNTRSEVRGPCYGLSEGGVTVTLMVALMPCHAVLTEHASFFLEPFRTQWSAWEYGHVLKALREVVSKSSREHQEYALSIHCG